MFVTRKAVRQKLLQAAVLEKIDREHLCIDTEQVRARLQRTREHVTGASLIGCMDRWEHLVAANDIDGVRCIVHADDDHAREMRNLSPLGVLLSESERLAVLDVLRDWQGSASS